MAIIEQLLSHLPEFYNTSEESTIYKLLYSIALELEINSSDINELMDFVQIDYSSGSYLDDLAKVFRIIRADNESDAVLRSRIKAFFQANVGGGTSDGIISALSNFTGVPEDNITLIETGDMTIAIQVGIEDDSDPEVIAQVASALAQSKAVGISTAGGAQFISADGLFRINISEINGEDIIIG